MSKQTSLAKFKRSKQLHVYEVWYPGPCGDNIVGFFRKKVDAKKAKAHHDSYYPYTSDHAYISRHKVK